MKRSERENEVLTAKETAKYLKVHVETVRRLARRRMLPAFKVGKDWRFNKHALRRWVEAQSKGPVANRSKS